MNKNLIYLDNNATTQLDERVFESMIPFLKDNFANANSAHQAGIIVSHAIKDARIKIANLINSNIDEITLTSGATESINIALKGIALHYNNIKKHIITVRTEHKAVIDTCIYLEKLGFEIDYLEVNNEGLIDVEDLRRTIRIDKTLLVCIMWVNNETGVIQPIEEIVKITHEANALFMTDATQAVGKIKTDVLNEEIDIMCFSPHKFYGPKGVGALYINKNSDAKFILPLHHGGKHENGLRSGTLNVPAIIGFGEACNIAFDEMESNSIYIRNLRDTLEGELLEINGAILNGNLTNRLFNTTNISFPNFDANVFIGVHQNIAVSNGSACTSALIEPSHVLTAMGLNNEKSFSALRFSLGKYNSKEDISYVVKTIREAIETY